VVITVTNMLREINVDVFNGFGFIGFVVVG
jgi:hypothetical protein